MTEADLTLAKQALRRKMESVRVAIPDGTRQSWSETICRQAYDCLREFAKGRGNLTILTFIPFRSEVNVWPFIARSWSEGIIVAAPKVNRDTGELELFAISGRDDLEAGNWGIMEPKADATPVLELAKIDAVIVPGLAFDRSGGRLGYGAGYYDRLFRRYEREGLACPLRIGVGFESQLVDVVPLEPHDYRVDWVVTNAEIVKCS